MTQTNAVLLVLVAATCLAFFGLGNNAFWDDEANTALFGRNLLHTGKLTAFDGTNLVGFRQGAELDSHLINVYMPPVQYYLAALGLKYIGYTTLGGRIPFVIAGLICIVILAWLARWHLRSRVPPWLPAMLVALNPAYLMFIRQCRYYAVVALVTVAILFAFSHPKARAKSKTAAIAGVAAASYVLMFSNYLDAVALAITLPIFFVLRRYRTRTNVLLLGIVYLCMLTAGIYVLKTANPLLVNVSYKNTVTGLRRIAWLFSSHITGLARFEFFPVVVPVLSLALLLFARRLTTKTLAREALLLCIAMVVYSAAIVAFSPQTVTSDTKLADMRYVVALMPVGALATAGALSALWYASDKAGPVLAIVVTSMILGTNAFTSAYANWQPLRSTLFEYINENSHNYTTGNEVIIDFLKRIPRRYVIRIIPDFMAYPAMFYVPHQRYCCQIYDDYQSKTGPLFHLPEYVYSSRVLPDFIFVGSDVEPQQLLLQCAAAYGPGKYRLLPMAGKDYRDNSRPEIPWHSFGPPKNPVRGFSVFQRVGLK